MRSCLTSAMYMPSTSGLAAHAVARIPPHQPVPMMPTLIGLIIAVPSCTLAVTGGYRRKVRGKFDSTRAIPEGTGVRRGSRAFPHFNCLTKASTINNRAAVAMYAALTRRRVQGREIHHAAQSSFTDGH